MSSLRYLPLFLALTWSCHRTDPPPPPAPAASQALPVETLPAPANGDVQAIVRGELARAAHEGRTLLVYVGAAWCEPCQRFHEAANAGLLDEAFPGLRLLEFDLDRDHDRLRAAGYASRWIPLFARPRADGTASGDQIEGSIKGARAVEQISPRLHRLLRGEGGDPKR